MKGIKNKTLLFSKTKADLEAGCDEAGRGCLAGPVVAAAVILGSPIEALNDSKLLSEKKRILLTAQIKHEALAYAVAFVDPRRIDQINILNASIEAMHLALASLSFRPNHILVDGNRFKPYQGIPYDCIIKGDGKYQSIAAASILAKTARDEYMNSLHADFPNYNWSENKGYPTKAHVNAIKIHGYCAHHRTSFGIVKALNQKSLFD